MCRDRALDQFGHIIAARNRPLPRSAQSSVAVSGFGVAAGRAGGATLQLQKLRLGQTSVIVRVRNKLGLSVLETVGVKIVTQAPSRRITRRCS